jgi:hypothetical protein
MESVIKGLHLLKDVPKPDIDKMEQTALMYWQKFGIAFKIIKCTDKDVTIRVTQENSPDGKYHNDKGLIGYTHMAFDTYFPKQKVLVNPVPHVPNPVDQVNSKWIQDRMLKTGTRLKDIADETGLNKSYLSNLTNGVDPLSDMAKAMFYYYFLSKKEQPAKSVRSKGK